MPAPIPPLLDPESFSNFFSRSFLSTFRFIYGLYGGPREEVEDLTSEVYLRAWKGRARFIGSEQDSQYWIFTIARHLVIDNFRLRKSHHIELIQSMEVKNIDDLLDPEQVSPEDKVIRREHYLHLWKALQVLPVERREMLVLRYMVGWQVKQIASFLEMEENTVSVYIRRSIEQIQQNWAAK